METHHDAHLDDYNVFKPDGLNTPNDPILMNEIQLKTSDTVRELYKYIDSSPDFRTDKGDPKTNLCDILTKRTYNLNSQQLIKFFELYEKCRLAGAKLYWQEKQQSESSGIMIDFDIYQNGNIRQMTFEIITGLCCLTYNILRTILRGVETNTQLRVKFFIIQKTALMPAQNIGPDAYKDGFHILIPEVKICRALKKYLILELNKQSLEHGFYDSLDLVPEYSKKILDKMSSSVPLFLYGSSKPDAVNPYELTKIIECSNNRFGGSCTSRELPIQDLSKYNLSHELSLNYSFAELYKDLPAAYCNKIQYDPAAHIEADILSTQEPPADTRADFSFDDSDISILGLNNQDAVILKQLLLILAPEYSDDYEKWRNVIYAIANASAEFKPLATLFSKQNMQKYDAHAVDRTWAAAISGDALRADDHKITKRSIYFWARASNPEKYRDIMNRSYHQILYTLAIQYEGNIEQGHIIKILKSILADKFVTDTYGDGINARHVWYEFIIPGQQMSPGEVYKWRIESCPSVLYVYIQEHLPKIYSQIISKIKEKKESNESPALTKWWAMVEQNLKQSQLKLFKTTFVDGIIRSAFYWFRRYDFTKQLDKHPRTVGVLNGVLDLAPIPRLITTYHDYKITKYMPVPYIPYDINNPYVQFIEKWYDDVYPEEDVRLWVKCYSSTTIELTEAGTILFIQVGGGCNGKTFGLELGSNALGESYSQKVPIGLFCDARESAKDANSAMISTCGKSMMYAGEPESLQRLNDGKIKEMFGNEKQSGRELYGRQQTFKMTAKPFLASNHDFECNVTDHGFWRRIYYYRNKIKFCADPDPNNPYEKMVDVKYANIYKDDINIQTAWLSTMVYYNQMLYTKYGGDIKKVPCETIQQETREFRNRQDLFNRFICRMIVRSNSAEPCLTNTIASRYLDWYEVQTRNKKHKMTTTSILSIVENSALAKYISTCENQEKVVTKLRILDSLTDGLRPGESKW